MSVSSLPSQNVSEPEAVISGAGGGWFTVTAMLFELTVQTFMLMST